VGLAMIGSPLVVCEGGSTLSWVTTSRTVHHRIFSRGSRLHGSLRLAAVPLWNGLPIVRPVRDALRIDPAVQVLRGPGQGWVSGSRRARGRCRRWGCC
jgi:hypothetical protein